MNKYFVYMLAVIGILFTACSKENEPFYEAPQQGKSYNKQSDISSDMRRAEIRGSLMNSRASYTLLRGRESVEFIMNIPDGFGPRTLVIANSSSSSEDLRYVIYMKKTGSSSWIKYTSSFWDIDPGDQKEISFSMNPLNYDMSQTKVKLINGGWNGSNTPVYADVYWQ